MGLDWVGPIHASRFLGLEEAQVRRWLGNWLGSDGMARLGYMGVASLLLYILFNKNFSWLHVQCHNGML